MLRAHSGSVYGTTFLDSQYLLSASEDTTGISSHSPLHLLESPAFCLFFFYLMPHPSTLSLSVSLPPLSL